MLQMENDMPATQTVPPRLATSVFGCFLLGALLLAALIAGVAPGYWRGVSDRALDRVVQTQTRSTALDFARALHADWERVNNLAQSIGTMTPEEARVALDVLAGGGTRISWAGLAGLDGQVIAASGGLLEGVDVSARPWFEAGLRSGFAGDVHDAVLLNRLLGGDEADPLRFIDFAVPVKDSEGSVVGVIATRTSFGWIEQFLTESAAVRDVDLFLVNLAGQVVFATVDTPVDTRSVQVLRAAATGVATQTREVWPDGDVYFAATVPSVAYADLPSFGWRLVARVPGDANAADRRALFVTLLRIIVGAVATFGLAAMLFAAVFVRPLARLVDSAERVAAGEHVYPPESRSSAEASRLSGALARIQSRLDVRDGGRRAGDNPLVRPNDPR